MTDDNLITLEEYERRRRAAAPPAPLKTFVAGQWQGKAPPARRWIVPAMIPEGAVTMLSGHGASGKSIIALQLAIACALGRNWLGRTVRPCKALVMACEDEPDELHRRCDAILRHYDAEPVDLEDRLLIAPRVGLLNALVDYEHRFAEGEETALMGQVMNTAVESGVELVVIDSLHDVFIGNENDRPQARRFVNSLRSIATETRGAVLLIAHPSRSGIESGSGESGSTAWHNATRSRMYLRNADPDQDGSAERILESRKANYAGVFDPISLVWSEGVFVAEHKPGGMVGVIEMNSIKRDFLDALDRLAKQGKHVTDTSNSPRYAPRVMKKVLKIHHPKQDLESAMNALFNDGEIVVGSVKMPNRHAANAIVRAYKEGS